jgi:hypothetical protein
LRTAPSRTARDARRDSPPGMVEYQAIPHSIHLATTQMSEPNPLPLNTAIPLPLPLPLMADRPWIMPPSWQGHEGAPDRYLTPHSPSHHPRDRVGQVPPSPSCGGLPTGVPRSKSSHHRRCPVPLKASLEKRPAPHKDGLSACAPTYGGIRRLGGPGLGPHKL